MKPVHGTLFFFNMMQHQPAVYIHHLSASFRTIGALWRFAIRTPPGDP